MGFFSRKRGRISEKWKYDAQSNLLAGPLVYDVDKDGRKEIVFGTKDGRVILMDEDSEVKWVYDVKEEIGQSESYFYENESVNSISAPPGIGDVDNDGQNEIVFGTEMGVLYVLDNKGMIRWKFKLAHAIRASACLHDLDEKGTLNIVFGCMDGNLYVLNSTGQLVWKYEAETPIEGTPIVRGKHILFGCHDGTIRCVKFKEGLVWQHKTKDKVVAQPVIEKLYNDSQDYVIVGSTDYSLYVLDDAGNLRWKYETEGAILSSVAIADINKDGKKEIVFGSCDNNVYALTRNGDKLWSYETYFWVVAPPVIDDIDNDGNMEVVVGSYDHNIYILDSEGVYNLDYVPGLGGVVNQAGHYADLMTSEPGAVQAKKIWQYNTGGFIVGYSLDKECKNIVVNTKKGKIRDLVHEK